MREYVVKDVHLYLAFPLIRFGVERKLFIVIKPFLSAGAQALNLYCCLLTQFACTASIFVHNIFFPLTMKANNRNKLKKELKCKDIGITHVLPPSKVPQIALEGDEQWKTRSYLPLLDLPITESSEVGSELASHLATDPLSLPLEDDHQELSMEDTSTSTDVDPEATEGTAKTRVGIFACMFNTSILIHLERANHGGIHSYPSYPPILYPLWRSRLQSNNPLSVWLQSTSFIPMQQLF